jgi:hypothetical protein
MVPMGRYSHVDEKKQEKREKSHEIYDLKTLTKIRYIIRFTSRIP